MGEFWNQSWDSIDMERVYQYIEGSSSLPDFTINFLKRRHAKCVCDAGCGCGVYSLRLALNGFKVFGFDISATAVKISKKLAANNNVGNMDFQVCSILETCYRENQFDAVISRDVIDHMTLTNGIAAVKELYRITKYGGTIILSLDRLDSEYEAEPHIVDSDGSYLFTDGKWKGMVFHPYSKDQISTLVQVGSIKCMESTDDGFRVIIEKNMHVTAGM